MAENAGNEVAITYETIFEILRREKNREELQKLDSRFYGQVFDYINSLKAEIKNFSMDSEKEQETEKLRIQLCNIKRMVTDIYNRRERKIMGIALIKSRTRDSIISTSALLDSEKEFFTRLCNTLFLNRKECFSDFEKGFEKVSEILESDSQISCRNKKEKTEEHTAVDSGIGTINTAVSEDTAQEQGGFNAGVNANPEAVIKNPVFGQSSPKASISKVKITENLPKFVGPNLEIYGPYNPGEITEVPQIIAKILIEQGKAQAE